MDSSWKCKAVGLAIVFLRWGGLELWPLLCKREDGMLPVNCCLEQRVLVLGAACFDKLGIGIFRFWACRACGVKVLNINKIIPSPKASLGPKL